MNIFEQIKKINAIKLSTSKPDWEPNSPKSVNMDFDNDGIVDELNYYFEQGAKGPNDR